MRIAGLHHSTEEFSSRPILTYVESHAGNVGVLKNGRVGGAAKAGLSGCPQRRGHALSVSWCCTITENSSADCLAAVGSRQAARRGQPGCLA